MTRSKISRPSGEPPKEATVIAPAHSTKSSSTGNAASPGLAFTDHLTLEGGVGRVYLAWDENIGRQVAVKEILEYHDDAASASDLDAALRNSFIHEAKITGRLEHPGIIPIYELGCREQHGPYYVMKYVKGATLEESFRKCRQSDPDNSYSQCIALLDTLIDVCDALAYAHSKGVIHRDIKPSNIITGKFGETIILDWGLAQVIDDQDNTQFYRQAISQQRHTFSDSSTSTAVGTPRYMAPEQLAGKACKASDVYSLGVILFRILCGRLPYQGSAEEIEQHLASSAPSPSVLQFNPSAAPELAAICAKAMAKDPQQRFSDAGELVQQLKAFRDGRMVDIYAYTRRELLQRFIARNKLLLIMLGALLAAVIGGAGFSLHYAMQMEQARNEAENALVTITAFGEIAQKQARGIAKAISSGADSLYSDLRHAAVQLGRLNGKSPVSEQQILARLQKNYPRFSSFTVIDADTLPTDFSLGWKTVAQTYDAPLARMEQGRLSLVFRVPIVRQGQIKQYLDAEMFPEQVIPALFPVTPESQSQPKDIWIMRNDGLIIYDKNPRYTGTNIFTAPSSQQSPTLLAFAKQTLSSDDGIGYYSFAENQQKVDKIAAWDTVPLGKTERWKIIVDYAYRTHEQQPIERDE